LSYRGIINRSPNPELADKIMCASYILAKGEAGVAINMADTLNLIRTKTLEELRAEVELVKEEKYKRLKKYT
jgi:hypothetical protein